VFAGLRIGELIDLHPWDLNLAASLLTVQESKTDAGVRRIDVLPVLRHELAPIKAGLPADADRLFPTQEGGPMNPSNIRTRILAPAVKLANKRLLEAGQTPLPAGLTPHKLRHTFASLLVATGVDPGAVMDQLGHTESAFTMRVYRHGMRRDLASKEQLQRLVLAAEWAAMGSSPYSEAQMAVSETNGAAPKSVGVQWVGVFR
jgi:integrase